MSMKSGYSYRFAALDFLEMVTEICLKRGISTLKNEWLMEGPRIGMSISILHVACAKGVTQFVKTLISEGDPINSHLSPGKETPLLIACMSGSLATVQILMSYGADPRQHDENGGNSIALAKRFRQ